MYSTWGNVHVHVVLYMYSVHWQRVDIIIESNDWLDKQIEWAVVQNIYVHVHVYVVTCMLVTSSL